jgi:hypothetical protein
MNKMLTDKEKDLVTRMVDHLKVNQKKLKERFEQYKNNESYLYYLKIDLEDYQLNLEVINKLIVKEK